MTNALLADILASLAHSAALPERLRRQTEQALRIRRALELETVSAAILAAAKEVDHAHRYPLPRL